MNYYPVNLDLRGRPCLVVGGGRVAGRKVGTLLDCEARVTVVSPRLDPALQVLAREGALAWVARPFCPEDLDGIRLVIAATDQPRVNRAVAEEARRRSIWCNVVDQPAAGTFILPSLVRRGDLMLTVSTAGRSPALARHLRKELEARFGDEYDRLLRLLGALRRRLLAAGHDPETHRAVFQRLVTADLIEAVGRGDWREVRRALRAVLGSAYDESLLTAAGAPAGAAEDRE
jgi:precorrin-2 dehydrogenase/sirohydrochlorin ferrochelatase